MPLFDGLGKALRWLRNKQDKRQYELAAEAGITKAMLSAYETGKQKPSIETLEKILEALAVDLADLHDALLIVSERAPIPGRTRRTADWEGWNHGGSAGAPPEAPAVDVYGVLGVDRTLPVEEERALREMLGGFHRLLRFLHVQAAQAAASRPLGTAPGDPSPG